MGRKGINDITNFDKSNIKYYYGISNYSTTYSIGKVSPMEAYEYAYKSGLNFLFLTDYNHYLLEEVYVKENTHSKFQASRIYASRIRKKYSDFLPLVGFKCKTNYYGDLNIINTSNFFSSEIRDLRILTLWMLNHPESFISITHPHKNKSIIPYNEILNKIITSIEVGGYSYDTKGGNYDKYYYSLLDEGWVLGAINGENPNKLAINNSENLTVCICNNLSTDNIISAFRERRTYSTESRYLKFYFTINDDFMGEEISISSDKLRFMIFAEDMKYKIREIQIISNRGKIIRTIENINLNSIKYLYEHKKEDKESWYVIKLIQDDNKITFSSPIFIDNIEF